MGPEGNSFADIQAWYGVHSDGSACSGCRMQPAGKKRRSQSINQGLQKKDDIQPIVTKKNGILRTCIDYRSISNGYEKSKAGTRCLAWTICLTSCGVLTNSTDLQPADVQPNHQVRLKPEDVLQTACTTPLGLFESACCAYAPYIYLNSIQYTH